MQDPRNPMGLAGCQSVCIPIWSLTIKSGNVKKYYQSTDISCTPKPSKKFGHKISSQRINCGLFKQNSNNTDADLNMLSPQ